MVGPTTRPQFAMINPDLIELILIHRNMGLTFTQIARELGLTKGVVAGVIYRSKIGRYRGHGIVPEEWFPDVFEEESKPYREARLSLA